MLPKTLTKIAVGLVAIAVLAMLFVRSVVNVGSEPYTIDQDRLANWTVALDPAPDASGVLLALWPQNALAPPLFSQLFTRSGMSLSGPNPVAMPLVLKSEFDQSLAGTLSPDALLALARDSGLESIQPKPLCMANRRLSRPGSTREVFFIRFEQPPFDAFRRQVAQQFARAGGDAGGKNGGFNPLGLSPIVIMAATDVNFGSWLPLQGDAAQDCLAPITVQ